MEHQNPFLQLLIKDGILVGTYKKDLHINLEVAHQIVAHRLAVTQGKMMPGMILTNGVRSIDKRARDFLASEAGTAGLSATAIIARSPFSSIMGNFFMMVNKTKIPVKMFSSPDKAALWLKHFVNE